MLTPHDIEVRTFTKGLRGYRTEEVNDFMQLLLSDYEKLYKENASLKSKMALLVEKIDEYKQMESSLRNALVSAQKMSENMIKEAQHKSDLIIADTNLKAERLINKINVQVYKEKQNLEDARRQTQVFKAKMAAMYQAQIALLDGVPEMNIPDIELPSPQDGEQKKLTESSEPEKQEPAASAPDKSAADNEPDAEKDTQAEPAGVSSELQQAGAESGDAAEHKERDFLF